MYNIIRCKRLIPYRILCIGNVISHQRTVFSSVTDFIPRHPIYLQRKPFIIDVINRSLLLIMATYPPSRLPLMLLLICHLYAAPNNPRSQDVSNIMFSSSFGGHQRGRSDDDASGVALQANLNHKTNIASDLICCSGTQREVESCPNIYIIRWQLLSPKIYLH